MLHLSCVDVDAHELALPIVLKELLIMLILSEHGRHIHGQSKSGPQTEQVRQSKSGSQT